jgi:fructoselysine-6-P-deglycase FrlB-like protein
MSWIDEEVASQPAAWARAVDLATSAPAGLPERGERLAVVGCGTSLHVARAYAPLREQRGHGEADAFPASEFPGGRRYDRVLAISRSGTTTEVLRLLEAVEGTTRTLITADGASPAVEVADHAIVLDFAQERSVVQTVFATSVLALLRAHVGEELGPIIAEGAQALDDLLPVGPDDVDHVVFLGHGWTVGVAEEAALKLREASATFTEAYPATEYRHGPISLAGPRSLVWILGTGDGRVAEDVRATGATVRVGHLDPMAELVLAQRMALALARAKGLDPDHPRHLTRSVVLS